MGRGTWTPDRPARHHNSETFSDQLYVEIIDLDDDTHDDFIVEEAYDLLKEVIQGALPESFSATTDRDNSDWFGHGFAVDTKALFSNSQVVVVWDIRGETWSQGVGVIVNPDAYVGPKQYGGLAERAAEKIFEKIKAALLEAYPGKVSVRTSAWTSARIPKAA